MLNKQDTIEMKLVKSELEDIRRKLTVCSHCGGVFVREDDKHRVCEICVKEAMEEEHFAYKH